MGRKFQKILFPITVAAIQVVFIILMWKFVGYDSSADAMVAGKGAPNPKVAARAADNRARYPMFQDVHVMIFIGFGFLMTFLRKYSFSSVSYNLLLSVVIIQWSTIIRALFHLPQYKINLFSLILADFDCGIVLISFGALLGKTSPMQLLLLAVMEVPLAQLNAWLVEGKFHAADVGGSMIIHAFGAYFGLAATLALYRKETKGHESNGSSYNSDIFAMIGTLFLWVFWPSFNGALADNGLAERAVINTYFALCAATVTTFCLSTLSQPRGKFKMVMVQNATLAGGVGVGSVANFMLYPWGALVVGVIAGAISVFGYSVLQSALERIKIHDTCGVHNLHGMPGVVAGIASVVGAAVASKESYGNELYSLFPLRASKDTTVTTAFGTQMVAGVNRSAREQALYQLASLGCTLGIAIVGGLITGLVLRIPIWDQVPEDRLFNDVESWEIPEEESEIEKVMKSSYSITTSM